MMTRDEKLVLGVLEAIGSGGGSAARFMRLPGYSHAEITVCIDVLMNAGQIEAVDFETLDSGPDRRPGGVTFAGQKLLGALREASQK